MEAFTFDGLREDGTFGSVEMARAYTSCEGDTTARVLVVRVVASWCGPCRAHAESTKELLSPGIVERVQLLDVLVRDEDNEPPDVSAAARWQAAQDPKTIVAIDPAMRLIVSGALLPRVLVIDPRSMVIRTALSNPAPEEIENAAASVLAEMDGVVATHREVERFDGFNRLERSMIARFPLVGGPPPDPSNVHGDRPGVAAFGKTLFDDKLLSPSGEVSCERCHNSDRAFTDGSEVAVGGVGGGVRNTPSILVAGWSRWQLWDGRADSLWMQALLPIEDAKEFGSSRLWVAHRVYDAYKERYEGLFEPLPPLGDIVRFPPSGKPGDAAWASMAPEDQAAVTNVFVHVGKSIAAFERSFRFSPNALDRYATGDLAALNKEEKEGLQAFFQVGCAQCHWGPRLTDDSFHVMRFPSGHDDFTPDNGRIDAAQRFDASEFRQDGPWSDAKQPRRRLVSDPRLLGSFKTPALRGAPVTAPYGHGGSVPTLEMAIELHRVGGRPEGDKFTTGTVEPWLASYNGSKSASLVAIVKAMSFNR